MKRSVFGYVGILTIALFIAASFKPGPKKTDTHQTGPKAMLSPADKFVFNSFVDCNMSEVWIGDKFMIFPGKYGEDPLWGKANDLKYATGSSVDEAFGTPAKGFIEPRLPPNAKPGMPGLHGAVWFESVYQDQKDVSGKTLYALYHNENYPETLPYDNPTGKGYKKADWPEGLKGPSSPSAVCRIGIMKSTDGGLSWSNRGLFLEDEQPRLILRPDNTAANFAGGTGDPSCVASGGYLYLFYGEYGYPGHYDHKTYSAEKEWKGQCISIARIALTDLDNPDGKAKRWDGNAFSASYNGIGKPVASIRIPLGKGGGPASSPKGNYYWGPSVSWNEYLDCWVMLMAKAVGPSWKGSSIYIAFNKNRDLGAGLNAQAWTTPKLLVDKPGHTLWYPSLQPLNTEANKVNKYSSLRLGRRARLFYKDIMPDKSEYSSEYQVTFQR